MVGAGVLAGVLTGLVVGLVVSLALFVWDHTREDRRR